MKRWLRDNGLTLTLMLVFLLSILGMAIAGFAHESRELALHGEAPPRFLAYLGSGTFVSAVFENWESEFLQMSAYVMLTAFLFQRGSAESLDPDDPHRPGDTPPARLRGRIRRWLYSYGLGLSLAGLFVLSFTIHWLASAAAANEEAARHGGEITSVVSYLFDPLLWFESFQNWQSEFLSTAMLIVLSIFLRFKGSPESKPVSAPHGQTGA
ncbi:membrane protein (plasmid) [Aminobacter sp. Y103A]|jgi:hypothetical protein|uniref:DUF6766 family protein n=1 Tax=Aminobacter sp. Y103A TaxID=1870862 RepID=UPI0025727BFA|nr:DUF6766 family protein [Aminobacter sp. SS-2016]BBD41182.1 membrane protein [Aminobacter sp. SS-2016]